MVRKTLTILFLLGLLTSAGAWAVSYWNWEYTHWKTEIALWGGTLVYRQHDAPPEKDAGWRCYGWISWPQTQWWPRHGSSLTHEWDVYPLWMPTALFAVLYYGLRLILLLRSFHRERHDRCRVCGCAVQDSLLCCRKCQTPVSMLTVGRGALSQVFLHLLVLTIGLTAASYWHYSWALKGGTTIALSKGSFICSWSPIAAKPGKHLAGYSNMKTNWVPSFNSIPFVPPSAPPSPVTTFVTQGTTYYMYADLTVTTIPAPGASAVRPAVPGVGPAPVPLPLSSGVRVDRRGNVVPSTLNAPTRFTSIAPAAPLAPVPIPGLRTLIVPFWIPLGVIGYVVWRLRFSPANLRRRRIKLGLCLTCGYDLRASKERCPECGTKIAVRSIEDNSTAPQPKSTSSQRLHGFLRNLARRYARLGWLVVTVVLIGLWALSYHGLEIRRHVMYGFAGEEFGAAGSIDDIVCFLDGIAHLHVASPSSWQQDAEAEVSQEFPLEVRGSGTSWALGIATPGELPSEFNNFEPSIWLPGLERPKRPRQEALGVGFSGHTVSVPMYLPTLVSLIWPALSLLPWYRRRARRLEGMCSNCGYDLRGSSDHCPECNLPFDAEVAEEHRRRAEQLRARMARRLAWINRSVVRKICVGDALCALLASIGVWVAQGVRPIHLYSTFDFEAIPHNAVLTEKVYDLKRKTKQVAHKVYYDQILGEHIRQPNAPFLMIGAGQGQLQFRWLEPTRWVDIMDEGTVLGYKYPVRETTLIPLWKVFALLATATALLAAVGPAVRRRLKAMQRCLHCSHDLSEHAGPTCPHCRKANVT